MAARVLYIGVGRPWAGGAGFLLRQRVFLRALADVTPDLHLALFDAAHGPPPPAGVASLTLLDRPPGRPWSQLGDLARDLFSPLPRQVRGLDLTATRAAVAALRPDSFDAVFAYRIDFGHYAGVLHHRRLVLDIDDPEHTRWARRAAATAAGADRRSVADVAKLRGFEHAAEAGAKLAFVCQPNDADGWPVRPEVVPNTVDLPPAPARAVDTPVVLFVGNCGGSDLSPNVDAVRHFLADVWPAVRAAVPAAEFHLVGSAGPATRAAVAAAQGGVLRGFVDDLAAAYATAAVSVAPIRFGTGTRVKILEAFAHACPVLATPLGAEGIAAVPGREIELGVGAADFAARCVQMLTDRAMAERIGAGGRALAERSFDAAAERRRLAARFAAFLGAGT